MSDVTPSLFGQGKNWRLNRTRLFFSPFFVQSQPRRHCLYRSGEIEKYVSVWRRNWERRGCIVRRFLEACRPNERRVHPSGQTPIFHVSIFYVTYHKVPCIRFSKKIKKTLRSKQLFRRFEKRHAADGNILHLKYQARKKSVALKYGSSCVVQVRSVRTLSAVSLNFPFSS